MKFDLLVDGNGNVIGIAAAGELPRGEFAKQFGVKENEVFTGQFAIKGGMLASNPHGKPYTYWSQQGRLQMARIAQLSAAAGKPVYFFERDGELRVFVSAKVAENEGFTMAECVKEMDASALMLLAASRQPVDDPYVLAYKKFLETYM